MRLRLLALVGAAGLVLASCSIPVQHGPSTISPSHVPFGLLSPQRSSTTTTQPAASTLVPVTIFLLTANDQLSARDRVVYSPAPLASVVTALLSGPTSSESRQGLSTEIPNNVNVISAVATGTTVTVNFNAAFALVTGGATELAVAQVVATIVTQNGLGTGVIFEISGQRISVPIASGTEVAGPVYLWQFI